MPRPWDRKLKQLFVEAPRDFVTWLLAGATFEEVVSAELDREALYADSLCAVRMKGQRALLHLEFQRRRDKRMAQRLWDYNVRATLQYQCPVWSCVIYLKPDGKAPEPFVLWDLPNGEAIHRFRFTVIKLWEIATEDLLSTGLRGLYPLLPLTREGARREVVEETIQRLISSNEEASRDLLSLTYGLASLVLTNGEDQAWLQRRFAVLYEILMETPAFQELAQKNRAVGLEEGLKEGLDKGLKEGLDKGLKEGLDKGLKEGLDKGLKEGQLKALRDTLLFLTEERFADPTLTQQVKGLTQAISDTAILQKVILKLSLAQNVEEVRSSLLKWLLPDPA